MLKKKKINRKRAGVLARAASVMADCASTAKSLDDWEFYMGIAIDQCNVGLKLLNEKAGLTLIDAKYNIDLWELDNFEKASKQYGKIKN